MICILVDVVLETRMLCCRSSCYSDRVISVKSLIRLPQLYSPSSHPHHHHHHTEASMTTVSSSDECPKCGTTKKSGASSCCARGGAWFKNCGDIGDIKFDRTWVEGIQACKSRSWEAEFCDVIVVSWTLMFW